MRAGRETCERKERSDRLDEDTVKNIETFFQDPKNVKHLPGAKDTLSVKNSAGKRESQRKLLLPSTLYHAHQKFLKDYPNSKVCYSKFSQLRPRNVVLPGSAGTHITCVCLHCDNPRLMVDTSVLGQLEIFKFLIDPHGKETLTVDKLLKR